MKNFITRHGQNEWNSLGRLQGRKDIELNEVGKEQAMKIGEKIKDEKINIIITSPLKRARETAEIIKADGKLKMRHVFLFESLIILPIAGPWRKFKFTANDFYVKEYFFYYQSNLH